jgi:L-threonylcarbamoyladenylate synthase
MAEGAPSGRSWRGRGRIVAADDAEAIASAMDALSLGELVGIPTDTVYGVAALPTQESVGRLIAAKGRDSAKGIPLLVDSLDQVATMAHVSPAARRLAQRYWPGPLTLVVPLHEAGSVAPLLTGGRSTIGVRVPDHDVPRSLARELGPLAVSSANLTGEPEARTADAVLASLGDDVGLVIDGGPSPGGVPSTVVEVPREGPPTVLREGAIPTASIMATALG